MLTIVAIQQLKLAGYEVRPADGVPGLWNVEGLARDVTTGQLADLARRHGSAWVGPLPGPTIRTDGMV